MEFYIISHNVFFGFLIYYVPSIFKHMHLILDYDVFLCILLYLLSFCPSIVFFSSIDMFKNIIIIQLSRKGRIHLYSYMWTLDKPRLPCPQPCELLLGWQSC